MLKTENLQNQICLAERTASLVQEIVDPLFKCFALNHFAYVKFFADGSILRLSTSIEWTKQYLELGLYREVNYHHPQIQSIVKNGDQNFLKVGEPKGEFNKALFAHDIWNSLTIATALPQAVETWCFGAGINDEGILDFYLNNLNVLNHFILYFKDRAHDLITGYKQSDLIFVPQPTHIEFISNKQDTEKFLAETNIKRYWIDAEQYLSSREIECAGYLLKGHSAKTAANLMQVSVRTVETHINNIKRKLGCNFKNELLKKLNDPQLLALLPTIT